MNDLPPIGSLGPPANTNLPWVQWTEIDNADDDDHNKFTAWKIYLVYLREGLSWTENDHKEIRHYFVISRVYRQSGETLTSPCPSQLWRAANLKYKNWTLALGHFLLTQYPDNDRLQFWADHRRVYPGIPGGAVRPRAKREMDRKSGTGIRTSNGTNNLKYMSISLGVDSYSTSTVLQSPENESSVYPLDTTPEPPQDGTSSQNSSREASYHTAYSPETVLKNALRELEPEFEQHDSKVAVNTRVSTPEMPDDLLQTIDEDENRTGPGDNNIHQDVKDQLDAIKGEIAQLSNELSMHKRSAATRRADIRSEILSTQTEQADSVTDLRDTLSKITERVSKVEKLTAEAGHSRNNSTQACFEQQLLETEKDINYLKRKHVIDTLDIDILKRQLAAQKNINTILIDKIASMERQMGQSGPQTDQLHTLNNRLNIPSEE